MNLEDVKRVGLPKVVDKPSYAAQQTRREKIFSTYELLLYLVNENCTTKRTEGDLTSQCKKNISYGFRPSGAWFQGDDPLTVTEIAQLGNPEITAGRFTPER
jgi:hypothetical protein